MIELTHTNGEKFNVDPDYIILIEDHDATIPEAKAEITLNNTILLVCETRQEVVRKVLEWKTEKDWMRGSIAAGQRSEAIDSSRKLFELAGLHDKKLDAFVDGIIKQMEGSNHDAE